MNKINEPLFYINTSIVYPPFKNGLYMEEYTYKYFLSNKDNIHINHVYIPIFWTNLQNHPGFNHMKNNYNILLQHALSTLPSNTIFFTIVQHDDGPQLNLPKNTIIFGACSGTVPLPLIYEDVTNYLSNYPRTDKNILASFVGTHTTHLLRDKMYKELNKNHDIICDVKQLWSSKVNKNNAEKFIELTLRSMFCLAPRGYGRSSFRFFEALLLDTVPVYFWDDIEWLPYKEYIDYSTFSISIHSNDINKTHDILSSISKEKYNNMLEEIKKIKHYFTLEGMCEYIIKYLNRRST